MSDTKAITPEFEAALNRYAPHEQRVIQEYIDLGNLSIRLMEFVGSNVFRELPKEGRDLLTGQIDVMSQLQTALIKRINGFNPSEPEPAPTCANGHGECCGGCLERKADAPAACQGTNCGATDGVSHSAECVTEAAKCQGWDTKVSWTVIDPSNPATLPTAGDWLVTVDDDGERELMEARHHGGGIWHSHSGFLYDPIIAWAPRPEAYSGPVPSEG